MIHPLIFFEMSGVAIHAGIGSSNKFKLERVGSAIDPMVIVLWGNEPEFLRVADAPRGASCRQCWRTSLIAMSSADAAAGADVRGLTDRHPIFRMSNTRRRGVRGGYNLVWDGHKCTPRGDIHERIATPNIDDQIWTFRMTTRSRSEVFWRFSRHVFVSVLLVFQTTVRRPAGSVGDRSLRRSLTWRGHTHRARDVNGSCSLTDLRLQRPQAGS